MYLGSNNLLLISNPDALSKTYMALHLFKLSLKKICVDFQKTEELGKSIEIVKIDGLAITIRNLKEK